MAIRSICSAPTAGKASLAAADDRRDASGSWQDGLLTTRSVVEARLDLAHRGQVRVQPLPVAAAQPRRRARELRRRRRRGSTCGGGAAARAPPGRCAGRRTRARRRRPDRRRAAAAGWRRGRSCGPSCRPRRPARRAPASGAWSAPPAPRRCADRPKGPSPSPRAPRRRPRTDPALSIWPVSIPPMPVWWPSPPPPFCSRPLITTRSALCASSGARIGDSVKSVSLVRSGVHAGGMVPFAENITMKRLGAARSPRARAAAASPPARAARWPRRRRRAGSSRDGRPICVMRLTAMPPAGGCGTRPCGRVRARPSS